ncbi:MAG: VTT domain-containing protein [Verrucomicrobia bacterium]|nr:VTT domain-containing protein [Verrucomicrobiota bacterium]MDE3099807.1 VTT domain-containing protein [Verrucomicrobiota bacterium]
MSPQWIVNFAAGHHVLVYGLIVALACAEGPILSMILGAFVRFGVFPFLAAYAALVAGDMIGDVFWYYVGWHFGHRFIGRFGRYLGVTEANVEKMTHLFHRYKHRILFVSKISNGLGLALVTLTTAGMVRIPFGIYLAVNVCGQLLWTGLLMGIGYFFSNLYVDINNVFGRVSVVVVAVVAVAALARCLKYLRRKAESINS